MSSVPQKPLLNRTLLLTRPKPTGAKEKDGCPLTQRLTNAGASIVHLPLIEIQPLPFRPPDMTRTDWIFFTSRNAVHAFFSIVPPTSLLETPIRIASVGPATAQALGEIGLSVTFIPQGPFEASAAAREFLTRHPEAKTGNTLWPCGNLADSTLADIFEEEHAALIPLVVYRTLPRNGLEVLERDFLQTPFDAVVFTSASAVSTFKALALPLPDTCQIACIGSKTAEAAKAHLGRVDIQPESHTLDALADALTFGLSAFALSPAGLKSRDPNSEGPSPGRSE